MRNLLRWQQRQVAGGIILLLALPCGQASASGLSGSVQQHGVVPSSMLQATTPAPSPAAATQPGIPSSAAPVDAPQQSQAGDQAPVGTAVAPYEKGVGVAASRPAGVVIAPGKQKRERSLLIKVGIILGAAIAVGTVAGLSSASSSRPH